MEDRAEVIKQHMQEKRAELSEKLQTLERQVTENISEAQETVTDTVENVAENVQQTVKSLEQALNLSHQVQEHPWLAVGGGILVGYLAYGFLTRGGFNLSAALAGDGKPSNGNGAFGEEIKNLERFAARIALELVGNAIKESMPGEVGATAGVIVNSLAASLTGSPQSQTNSQKGGS